jgi:hypothetical protein
LTKNFFFNFSILNLEIGISKDSEASNDKKDTSHIVTIQNDMDETGKAITKKTSNGPFDKIEKSRLKRLSTISQISQKYEKMNSSADTTMIPYETIC